MFLIGIVYSQKRLIRNNVKVNCARYFIFEIITCHKILPEEKQFDGLKCKYKEKENCCSSRLL